MKTARRNKQVAPIQLTARDVEIILSVYENRFLKRDQIQRLHFAGASVFACNRRLKKLDEHKFLDKLIKPVAVGSHQLVYALGKQGADVVAAALEIDRHKVRWSRAHNRVEFLFLEHTLGISEIRVCLDLALAGRREELFFYQRGDRSHLRRISVPESKKKYLVVAPDAFFGIQVPKGKYAFFLEVDLGTETLSRFAEKITAYKQYWKSGKYQQDYGYRFFRVLTVTESERRMANLIKATGKAGGRKMFLFTNFHSIQNAGVLEPVWFAPASSEPISILD
ncbi:MAG: replication-relaxation family protein [Thermoleophilia bacterium]